MVTDEFITADQQWLAACQTEIAAGNDWRKFTTAEHGTRAEIAAWEAYSAATKARLVAWDALQVARSKADA
jgi:hypothetical protein